MKKTDSGSRRNGTVIELANGNSGCTWFGHRNAFSFKQQSTVDRKTYWGKRVPPKKTNDQFLTTLKDEE